MRVVTFMVDDERTGPLPESGDIIIQHVVVNSGFFLGQASLAPIPAASATRLSD